MPKSSSKKLKKTSKLSFNKFENLFLSHNYTIPAIYFITELQESKKIKKIVFLEARLPKTQKSIIIYVSPKFMMLLPNELGSTPIERIKMIEITQSEPDILNERSVQYLIDIRGPLIESDLVIISSRGLCYSKFNGENISYLFVDNMPKNAMDMDSMESQTKSSSDDEIDMLDNEIKSVAKKKGIKLSHKKHIKKNVQRKIIIKETQKSSKSSSKEEKIPPKDTEKSNTIKQENTENYKESVSEKVGDDSPEEHTSKEEQLEEKDKLILEEKEENSKETRLTAYQTDCGAPVFFDQGSRPDRK